MYSYEITELNDNFGYVITKGDVVIQKQEYNPDTDGFVPMSEEEATAIAEQIIQDFNNVIMEAPEEVKTPEQIRIEQLEAILYKPNPNELFLSLDVDSVDLEELRTKKLEQLNYRCKEEILAGFTSSALGAPHFYDFDEEAQGNLSGCLNLVNGGQITPETIISWKTDGVPQDHTTAQFSQVCVDSFIHKQTNITKYWTKKYAVLAITTKEDILTVNWDD